MELKLSNTPPNSAPNINSCAWVNWLFCTKSIPLVSMSVKLTKAVFIFSNQNLTALVKGEYVGDFSPIHDALNYIIYSLNHSFGEIKQSLEEFTGGANQISQSSSIIAELIWMEISNKPKMAEMIQEIFKIVVFRLITISVFEIILVCKSATSPHPNIICYQYDHDWLKFSQRYGTFLYSKPQ